MPIEPALVALGTMDAASRGAYDAALPGAVALVGKLPLVRVIVPESRKVTETDDALRDGKLLPRHKSPRSIAIERRLGAGDGLYFHAGRTHPAYGKVALVLRPLPEEDRAEVTPFGLGGLLCAPDDRNAHEQNEHRECTTPVAHLGDAEQAAFVTASTWRSGWRARASQFVAAFFGADLDAYFAGRAAGRPARIDAAGLFHPATGSRDWRSWTFEVRILTAVDLHDVLRDGRVMMWAMEDQLYNELILRAAGHGEPVWWFSKLLASGVRRITLPNGSFEDVLEVVDREVKQACRA